MFYVIIFETSPENKVSSLIKKYVEANNYTAVLSRGVGAWWELEEPWEDTSALVRAEPALLSSTLSTSQAEQACYT